MSYRSHRLRPTAFAVAILCAAPHVFAEDNTLSNVDVTSTADTQSTLQSYRVPSTSNGALGDRSILDTPFSETAVTARQIADQQSNQISEVFKNDASVTAFGNAYAGESSGISIRGLQVDLLNGIKIDGLAAPVWGSDLPLEVFDQVELLKGLSGFMYGFGSPGGIINYVLKRPTNAPYRSVTLGYESDGILKGAVDLGGRFDDNRFGYRVNAVQEQGDTAVDNGYVKRTTASVAADMRITPDLVWSVDAMYNKRHVDGAYYGVILGQDYGLPVTEPVKIPSALDGSKGLGSPFTYYETSYRVAGTNLAWSINPQWDARLDYRYSWQDRTNRDSAIFLTDNSGGYTELQWGGYSTYKYQTAQALLNGHLETGSIKHELVMGVAWQQQDSNYPNQGDSSGSTTIGSGNIYNMTAFANPNTWYTSATYLASRTVQKSLFGSDTIKFNDQWSTILGLRYNKYDQDNYDTTGATSSTYDRSPVTPTIALIYKPVQQVSIYGSYVESLEQGGTAPIYAINANESLAPLKSKQYEAGVKAQYQNWGGSAALFRINRGLEFVNSAQEFVQDGQTRYQGLELNGAVNLAKNWTLTGSTMWLDAKNVEASSDIDGKRAYGAPRFQASANVEYAVPQIDRLTLLAGAQYVGDRALEADNSNIAPSYTLYDLGARYVTAWNNTKVTLRLNLDNITNEKYWLTSWGFILNQGEPRTVKASAQFDF
ncbi:TonB-dependent siderophore receptor [Silvimonas iriomotensis]|uniref:Ligand-gated channel n=1 Tax=Silvimonas iriomotensis TaxID=449662 RepID=A0ABQ2P4X3_9NEIS|nr:TonB-dependent siderophore receptor [Silvimonas iriomotensis]GGP18316.1 ligand-gated channel [Silvimonas iriomotensis]